MTQAPSSHWIELVIQIEYGLDTNLIDIGSKDYKHFPLISLEQKYRQHHNYGRIMAALIDLKLTFQFLTHDFSYACGVFNEQLHVKVLEGRTEKEILSSKILFLKYLNMFILRCRSFWDKAMGIMVLVLNSDNYDVFLQANSRRKTFKKVMHNHLTEETIINMDALIKVLDNKFRTAEAHQTGTLRTWIFKKWDSNPMNTPFGDLLGIYNLTFEYAEQISKLLENISIVPNITNTTEY